MKKYFALALVLLLLVSMTACGDPKTNTDATKTQAPNFLIYDEGGNIVRLSDYLGTPVVVNFWASWCEPCKMEMPVFQEGYETYGDKVQFMMVNMTDGEQETQATATAFINEQGFSFPVFYDSSSTAAFFYGLQSIPATIFVDAEGYIVSRVNGLVGKEQLREGIEMILP
jgi:thiol-disulfide isomerase/thioredoxin